MYISRQLLFLAIVAFLVGYFTRGWFGISINPRRGVHNAGSSLAITHSIPSSRPPRLQGRDKFVCRHISLTQDARQGSTLISPCMGTTQLFEPRRMMTWLPDWRIFSRPRCSSARTIDPAS
jgi:hypothetical protein